MKKHPSTKTGLLFPIIPFVVITILCTIMLFVYLLWARNLLDGDLEIRLLTASICIIETLFVFVEGILLGKSEPRVRPDKLLMICSLALVGCSIAMFVNVLLTEPPHRTPVQCITVADFPCDEAGEPILSEGNLNILLDFCEKQGIFEPGEVSDPRDLFMAAELKYIRIRLGPEAKPLQEDNVYIADGEAAKADLLVSGYRLARASDLV